MENVFTGKTVEEAVETGLKELGASREDVEVEILEEGKKKLFGSKPAQVKLTVKEKLTDGERAVRFLEGLMPLLGDEDVTVALRDESEKIVIELVAESAKGIIGRRGEIIDAVQILAGVVDCENYRETREETLRRVANKLAAKAVRLGKRVRLEPMNPYERRIIHSALVDNPDVTTKSEGKEPARFVVIIPKNMRSFERGRGGRDGKFDRNRNGRGGRDGKFDRERGSRYGERKPYPKRELPAEGTPESSGTSLKREGGSSTGFRKGGFSGFFGTYLGNDKDESATPDTAPQTAEESSPTPFTAPEEKE